MVVARALKVFNLHAGLILFVLAYYLAANATAAAMGKTLEIPWNFNVILSLVLFGLAAHVVGALWSNRPERPFHYLAGYSREFLTLERLLGAAIVLALLPLHSIAFMFFKLMIPLIRPFSWDEQFAAWDQALHFGRQPWEYLQFNSPLVTRLIDASYLTVFGVMAVLLGWYIFCDPNSKRRQQFLWTYLLSWFLLGNVAATALSSAGPCYYAHLVPGSSPFAPLMASLSEINQTHPLHAVFLQEFLWTEYLEEGLSYGQSISAMPSMHVSIAALLVIATWNLNRWIGLVMLANAILILVGSVHLGWHYALDGYAAAIGTWLIWRGCGWMVGSRLRRDREAGSSPSIISSVNCTHPLGCHIPWCQPVNLWLTLFNVRATRGFQYAQRHVRVAAHFLFGTSAGGATVCEAGSIGEQSLRALLAP